MTEEKSAAELLAEQSRAEVQEQMPPGVFVEGELEKKEEELYEQFIKNIQDGLPEEGKADLAAFLKGQIVPAELLQSVPLLSTGTGLILPALTPYGLVDSVTICVCIAPGVFDVHVYVRGKAVALLNRTINKFIGYPDIPLVSKKTSYIKVARFSSTTPLDAATQPILMNPACVEALLKELKTRKDPFSMNGMMKFIDEHTEGPNILVGKVDEQHTETPQGEQECDDGSDGDREGEGSLFIPEGA